MSDDGPPPVPPVALSPRPADPGRGEPSPAVGPATRARLDEADRDRIAALAEDGPGTHLRATIGLALGALALGAAWRFLGPGRG